MKKPYVLIILDGFGISTKKKYNAIYQAKPHHWNKWLRTYSNTELAASQEAVGLLPGMIGNSEVGHLTIGAGRVIEQPVTFFLRSIDNGSFFEQPLLLKRLAQLKKSGGRLHIIGLLSDAGVHSHQELAFAAIRLASKHNVPVSVHPFLDGRDVPPKSASTYLTQLETVLRASGGQNTGIISSIHGRFYAMDRDHHFDRTAHSVNVLTGKVGTPQAPTWQMLLEKNYTDGITDEFITPTTLEGHTPIRSEDAVFFFNWRADRTRQLTQALWVTPQSPASKPSWFITATEYQKDFDTDILLGKKRIKNTLLDVISGAEKKIFTIAESEKYAHVTYFFNGGTEKKRSNETRIIVPSHSVASYAEDPHMSAAKITEMVTLSLEYDPHDFYLINYANADMVGHSGDLEATIEAIKWLDIQLNILFETAVQKYNGTMYITSDHGNAEDLYNTQLGQPLTAHTLNPVPFLVLRTMPPTRSLPLELNTLSDIAPFILRDMQLQIPPEMEQK